MRYDCEGTKFDDKIIIFYDNLFYRWQTEILTFWNRYQLTTLKTEGGKHTRNFEPCSDNGKFLKMLYSVCGITESLGGASVAGENSNTKESCCDYHVTSIDENSTWRIMSNIVAILLISAALFTYVYWA